jgi:hypothetical protein
MVELALLQMLLMCGPHFRSDVIVDPRYFAEVRYVTNKYHNTSYVSDMLDQLEWPSLESRRTNSRLTMIYKMTKNLANVDTSDKRIPLQRPS